MSCKMYQTAQVQMKPPTIYLPHPKKPRIRIPTAKGSRLIDDDRRREDRRRLVREIRELRREYER
jgi:hypothetical protein